MHFKWFLIIALILTFGLQGCETTKGLKQAGKGFVSDVKNFGSSLRKTDDWIREHLW